jgi:hypothetical protein
MVLTTRFKLLCAAAAAVGVYVLASGPESTPATVAVSAPPAERASAAPAGAILHSAARAAGRDSEGLLARLAHRVTESKAVEALFHSQSWYIAPPPPPPPPPAPVVAPPPPTAPPLPFTAMGSYARPGDAKVYFLTRGDRVFDVHVGDTIDNTYSVDGEANGQLTLTYKPLNIQQTLAIGGSQ